MFIVATVRCVDGTRPIPQAVFSRTAGGCTAAEAPRENARMLRAAAARDLGGQPLDYEVVRDLGRYTDVCAAIAIRDAWNGDPTAAPMSVPDEPDDTPVP
jgi:hypothetical protein